MPTDLLVYRNKLDAIIEIWTGESFENLDSERYIKFAKFIGHPFRHDDARYIVDISKPEVQQILDTLHGPHTKALLKVMEIRNKEKANG